MESCAQIISLLGTVTLKSWFSNPGIIKQKHPFSYTPYKALLFTYIKTIDVLLHSGYRVTPVLPEILWCIYVIMNYTSKNTCDS